MDALIKQLFTPNSTVAQLFEHCNEGPADLGLNQGSLQKILSSFSQNEYHCHPGACRKNVTVP